ncbi:FAD:protein FMN transferase [Cellvibrio sp. KY-YJ-3]|uniref:FAD:protein FMN transferase n=1 Tax=Cellvibrio sp. KY-YJ-3 TaxID=454662 RepID=UPI001CD9F5CD|nr:FAD:protein FMN transferase [Cellvibrio sp. KY-YJ-3]
MRFIPQLALLATSFFIISCSPKPEMSKIEGFAQGTTYNLTFELPTDSNLPVEKIETAISEELARMDKVLSNYRDDSVIEQFNAQKTTEAQTVDAELVELVEIARTVHRASNGCYDLTIKPLFDLWGFKNDVFTPPSEDALGVALASIGLDNLETVNTTQLRKQLPNLRIDVSSIGQGYAVERMVKILEQFGVQNYLVEIGGELKIQGKKTDDEAWRIALEKPLPNERKMHKIVSFDSGEPMSLISSGTYRHFFDDNGKRYSHILDARSGKPVEHNTVSVTILHPDATLGDAWSTAFSCLGSREGLKVANAQNLAVLFIDQEGDQLIETESDALKTMSGISFKNP